MDDHRRAQAKAESLHRAFRYLALHPRTVVDVGCGDGQVLERLKELRDAEGLRAVRYEGWDIDKAKVKQARLLETERLRFVPGDFLASERRADLVMCVDTLEHVADDIGFLRALRERADWFVFRIPLDVSVLDAVAPRRLLAARRRWGHRHAYNRPLAIGVLEEAGYRVESEFYDRLPLPSRRRGRAGNLVRRIAHRIAPHAAATLLGGFSLMVCASPDPARTL